MKLIRPAASDGVHDTAATATVLRAVRIRLERELLDRIWIGKDIRNVGVGIFVEAPIQKEGSRVLTGFAAGGNETGPGLRSCRFLIRVVVAYVFAGVWRKRHELQNIATIERDVLGELRGDREAYRLARCVH